MHVLKHYFPNSYKRVIFYDFHLGHSRKAVPNPEPWTLTQAQQGELLH